MLQKFESWIDEQGTFAGNNPITLSPSQRSTAESEGIVRTSSSSSLSSFDNLEDNNGGLNKLSFYSKKNSRQHQTRNKRHDVKSFEDDVAQGESHEVMFIPRHELQGRDDTETYNNYTNDDLSREIMVLNEKYGMKSFISNMSNQSASNLSTGTPEWGVREGVSGSSHEGRVTGSVASAASSNEEVATFKSRLGSIQKRRLTRQKSKQKPPETPNEREHSPIVRFF